MNSRNLSIVADQNMPMVDEMFADFASISKVDGRTLTAQQLQSTDILLVRSITQVNEALLKNTPVKFVGSATIGTDHVDLDFLRKNDIAFSSAPGCNADAVVEYDISCFSHLLAQSGEKLQDKCVAIVGVGNVGQRLADKLLALGVKELLLNDPIRAQAEEGFVDLASCLARADIIAVHTPLVLSGQWPTHHLFSSDQLNSLKPNAILLNAGRGAAICEKSLQKVLTERSDLRVVLDVWEHEPQVTLELAEKVKIATPHIADTA